MSTAIQFRVVRQPSATADTDLVDLRPLREAFNQTASSATLEFLDTDQTKIDDYPYGQKVDIQFSEDGGSTWTTRLQGLAADRTRTTDRGYPALRVEALAFNHLLRRRKVYKTYSSSTVSTILQDLIETFTGVTWDAANVTVTNDKTISREFKGERVDQAIGYLASISADEEWFVNDSLEFVFQPQSSSTAPAIDDTEVIDHDFPSEATVSINRFELFYGPSGNRDRLVVEDLPQQEDLKDKLGAARAVEISESDTMPEITDRDRAEEIARQRLDAMSEVITGKVTVPLGRFTTEVGDVLDLTVLDANITNEDFRVAAIEYRWQDGKTQLTLAENADFVDDILVALSDDLDNVRAREADPTVTATQFVDVISGVTLSVSATLTTKTAGSGFTFGQSQFGDTLGGSVSSSASVSTETNKATVSLLNLCRDLWQDGNTEFVDLTHVGVGTDDAPASKGDTAEASAVDRVTVEKFGAGDTAERFEVLATVPAGGVFADAADLEEFVLADADSGGNIYTRTTFAPTTIDANTRLKIRLEVTVDTDSDLQGATTAKGQERLRDLVIGESNHEPATMLYGTGTTAASESDTALASQQHSDAIDSTADRSPGVTDIVEETTSGEANTANWSEVGYENSGNELLARTVFAAIPTDRVVVMNYRWAARNA